MNPTDPPLAPELGVGRRGFLAIVGAALASASAAGCRRAVERAVPYVEMPEKLVPGVASHYATVYPRRGEALGLVVECHEGKPTKVEGNPLHPSSLGAADLLAQAAILDLYDPNRSVSPTKAAAKISFESALGDLKARLSGHVADGGARLRLLVEPSSSPTMQRLRAAVKTRFPKAQLHVWSPVDGGAEVQGTLLSCGVAAHPVAALDKAAVVVAIDADFLGNEPGSVRAQKLFAAGRRLTSAAKSAMNRLYVIEPTLTVTGTHADHRLRLPASQVESYVVSLAAELVRSGVSLGELDKVVTERASSTFPLKWIVAVARDLVRQRGKSIVLTGSGQPPLVHALVLAINVALGNVGKTLEVYPTADPKGEQDLRALTEAMAAGSVDTLLLLGGNPVYDAPADLGFADKLGRVPFTAHLSSIADETSEKCVYHLPRAHEFEAWADQVAHDGTTAVQQPLINPIFDGRSDLEMLALVAGLPDDKSHELVRLTARAAFLAGLGLTACGPEAAGVVPCKGAADKPVGQSVAALDFAWKKALHDGVLPKVARPLAKVEIKHADLTAALLARPSQPAPTAQALEVQFVVDAKMLDGRHANNSWLQELPDPITKVTWDNAALISPATAKVLGLATGDGVELSRGGRSIRLPVLVQPGTADHVVALPLGWGRRRAGSVGNGRGFDVYPLRTSDAPWFAPAVALSKTGLRHGFALAQKYDSADGRPLVREATRDQYVENPSFAEQKAPPRRSLPLWESPDYGQGHQWGLAIDLNACTGCTACVVACQAENNIPVVGKEEVERGRAMQWLRIDRYLVEEGPDATPDDPRVALQPLACQQCEAAPCENVCPVAATVHSPEGLSEVAYNRCIGTRYCANNCPYKARRFNYLTWQKDGVWKEVGRLPELLRLQQNPNVTVRSRGIVEKCSYCVQRIQAGRYQAKREGRELRDGDIKTACQQTCPSDAIVFGDLNDPGSAVAALAVADRRYALLEELGTKPRTTYLAKVRNPNPEMA